MIRVGSVLVAYVYALLGVFLLAAPWSPVWEAATLAIAPTEVGGWMRSGWIRGLVSGLGALNIAVAVQDTAALWSGIRAAAVPRERA